MKALMTGVKVLTVPLLVLVAGLFFACRGGHGAARVVSGEIEARQIDVASKIPARVDTILVREGESVLKGQVIARLASPELEARIGQAQAAVDAAKAMLDLARHGARAEDKEAARQNFEAAKAQADLAKTSFKRIRNLYEKCSVTRQTFDETKAKRDAATAQMNAAQQLYDKAVNGARREEIETARGNYDRACQALAEVQVMADEREVKAPQSGEIEKRVADPGEVIAAGYPLLTLVDLNDVWITLYLTEDQLPGVAVGHEYKAQIPALGLKDVAFKVDFVNPAGEFATKRAMREQDGFDLKTFEIHLRPVKPVPGLRAGMSVRVTL
jgi:HlyD family secretion protein